MSRQNRVVREGDDSAVLPLADDEVAFPVAGHGAVFCLGGPLADGDDAGDRAALVRVAAAPAAAPAAAAAQRLVQLGAQAALALHEQRLVDGLVAHLHPPVARMLQPQPALDLPRRIIGAQHPHHLGADRCAGRELAGFRPPGPLAGHEVGRERPVHPGRRRHVPVQLPGDGRRGTPQRPRDLPDSLLAVTEAGDLRPLGECQPRPGHQNLPQHLLPAEIPAYWVLQKILDFKLNTAPAS
jgi:hypothetical protein